MTPDEQLCAWPECGRPREEHGFYSTKCMMGSRLRLFSVPGDPRFIPQLADEWDERAVFVASDHYAEAPDKWMVMSADVDVIVLHDGKPSLTMRKPTALDSVPSAAPRTVTGVEARGVLERGGVLGLRQHGDERWRMIDGDIVYGRRNQNLQTFSGKQATEWLKDNRRFLFTVLDEGRQEAPPSTHWSTAVSAVASDGDARLAQRRTTGGGAMTDQAEHEKHVAVLEEMLAPLVGQPQRVLDSPVPVAVRHAINTLRSLAGKEVIASEELAMLRAEVAYRRAHHEYLLVVLDELKAETTIAALFASRLRSLDESLRWCTRRIAG